MANPITIIGIDPGSRITGFGVVQKNGFHLKHIDSGIISTKTSLPLGEKLFHIHQELLTLLELHKPLALSLEKIFYAKNVQSALTLAHARGTIMMTAAKMDIPVFEYSALEIKSASVGYGRASKEQMFEMVKRLLNLQNDQIASMDQTDALSCAICHLNHFDLQQRITQTRTV